MNVEKRNAIAYRLMLYVFETAAKGKREVLETMEFLLDFPTIEQGLSKEKLCCLTETLGISGDELAEFRETFTGDFLASFAYGGSITSTRERG